MSNRIKAVVLAFFVLYWVSVLLIWIAARQVFDQVGGLFWDQLPAEVGGVVVLSALFTLLSVGIVRGWRWTFWLILVAFLAGILRVPIAVFELAGKAPQQGLAWFVLLTAVDSVRHRTGDARRLPQVGSLGRILSRRSLQFGTASAGGRQNSIRHDRRPRSSECLPSSASYSRPWPRHP